MPLCRKLFPSALSESPSDKEYKQSNITDTDDISNITDIAKHISDIVKSVPEASPRTRSRILTSLYGPEKYNDSIADGWRYDYNASIGGLVVDVTQWGANQSRPYNVTSSAAEEEEGGLGLNELQLIKAIVLVVVFSVLILSTCKVVLKTFSRYSGSKRDDM